MDLSGLRLVLTADAVGGIWTYALDLGRGLRERGARVTLAVLGPNVTDASRATAEAAGLGVINLGHPPEWLANRREEVEAGAEALVAVLRRNDATLLQLNHPAFGALASYPCPVLTVCHSCVATWWRANRTGPLPPDLSWQADLVGAGCRAAATLVAPSRAFAADTARAYDLASPPQVVPNGRAAAALPARDTEPVTAGFTAGRLWDEGKNIAVLDRAAGLSRVPIRVAGPQQGPNGAQVALAHCEALGALSPEALRANLAERPVYLSPARYEPFGLAVLEAAQAGCALLLSDIPSFREIWGDAALFVPPDDAAGFASALERLVDDPGERARLGRAAQTRAGLYTLDRQVEAMARLMAGLGPAHPGGAAA